MRYAVLMSTASSAFFTLIGMGSKTLTTRTMQESAVSLKNVSVEMRPSRCHFRPLSC